MKMGEAENNLSREFWAKRLAAKQNELALVEVELEEERDLVNEDRLTKKAKRLLKEIEQINKELLDLDKNNTNSNVGHLSLEKSFQKIDNDLAKKIAQSVKKRFGEHSGVSLLFLQRFTKQRGIYCLNEVLDLIISDRKIGDAIYGDFRPYEIDLGSPISNFNEAEFTERLVSQLSPNSEETLDKIIKKLCSSLQGGSTVFIKVQNWDSVIERKKFLDWFMENFWKEVRGELDPVFKKYSKIRFIVVLIAKRKVFSDCCSLDYFCSKNTFDPCKILELPLSDWDVDDIKGWLKLFQGLSDEKSQQLAQQYFEESEGTPDTICSILEREFKVC